MIRIAMANSPVRIAIATAKTLGDIEKLLRTADLPSYDIAAHLNNFWVACRSDEVVGAVGLEVYGTDALLRSLVVDLGQRKTGVGGKLLNWAMAAAREKAVTRLWLLTTDADAYFERVGFGRTDRNLAPPGIKTSAQFQGLCPASARCYSKKV